MSQAQLPEPTTARQPRAALPRGAAVLFTVLVCLILVAGATFAFRHGLIAFALNRLLAAQEVHVVTLEGLEAGRTELTLTGLTLQLNDDPVPLRFDTIRATYTLADLLRGRVESLSIVHAVVHVPAANEAAASGPSLDPALIDRLQALPQRLHIQRLDVAPYLEAASLTLIRAERDIQLQLALQDGAQLDLTINTHDQALVSSYFLDESEIPVISPPALSGRLRVGRSGLTAAEADFSIIDTGESLLLQAGSQVTLEQLQLLLARSMDLPARWPDARGVLEATVAAEISEARTTYSVSLQTNAPLASSLASVLPDTEGSLSLETTGLFIEGDLPFSSLHIRGSLDIAVERFAGIPRLEAQVGELKLTCQATPDCLADFHLTLSAPELPLLQLQAVGLSASAPVRMRHEAGIFEVQAGAGTIVGLQSIETDAVEAEQLLLEIGGLLQATVTGDHLQLHGQQLSLQVPFLKTGAPETGGGGISQLQLQLPALEVQRQNGWQASLEYVVLNMASELLPVNLQSAILQGSLDFRDQAVSSVGDLHLNGQHALVFDGSHNLATRGGSAQLAAPGIQFDTLWSRLSNFVSPLPIPLDLLSGSISGTASPAWQLDEDNQWQVNGAVNLLMQDLSGFYEEIGFLGVSTRLALQLENNWQLRTTEVETLTVTSVDPGVPIENIRLDYEFATAQQRYRIADAYAEIFGGTVASPGGTYTPAGSDTFQINITQVDLGQMLDMAAYDAVSASGEISGVLPLTLGESVVVTGGRLSALPPGGSIRYQPAGGATTGNASLDLVYSALSNYQYHLLNAAVDYQPDGDLILAINLEGVNPDMAPGGQAINLNLNVEDNIPALLQSLQAARSITDALENRLEASP